MAAYDITRSQAASAGFFSRVGQTFATLTAALVQWNDARQTRKALASLSDHELEDIGLIRGDIEGVARRTR